MLKKSFFSNLLIPKVEHPLVDGLEKLFFSYGHAPEYGTPSAPSFLEELFQNLSGVAFHDTQFVKDAE